MNLLPLVAALALSYIFFQLVRKMQRWAKFVINPEVAIYRGLARHSKQLKYFRKLQIMPDGRVQFFQYVAFGALAISGLFLAFLLQWILSFLGMVLV